MLEQRFCLDFKRYYTFKLRRYLLIACKSSLRLWMLTTKNKFNDLMIFFNDNLEPTVLNESNERNLKSTY